MFLDHSDKINILFSIFILLSQDGSYLPSVSTLPSHLKSRECLLLMVPLLSPGVVAGQAKGKAQTVESTSLRSHIYNSLIVWFMSLVCIIVIKLGNFDWINT